MKAIIWQGGKKFAVSDVPIPKFGDEQVLIRVKASSICTTDFHYDSFECVPPIVPGHEVSGIIVEVGGKIDKIIIGRRVTVDPVQRCGQCRMCKSGVSHLCLNVRHIGDTDIPGGWAEFMPIDLANTYDIPDGVTFAQAALTEPSAVCLESLKRADFKTGQSILIFGDGVFGFIHAMLAKLHGAEKIIVAGHYDERLKRIADKTKAITCNTHDVDLDEFIKDQISDGGVDVAIEATGATVIPNSGLEALRPRGTLILFSYVWKPEILNLGLGAHERA